MMMLLGAHLAQTSARFHGEPTGALLRPPRSRGWKWLRNMGGPTGKYRLVAP